MFGAQYEELSNCVSPMQITVFNTWTKLIAVLGKEMLEC